MALSIYYKYKQKCEFNLDYYKFLTIVEKYQCVKWFMGFFVSQLEGDWSYFVLSTDRALNLENNNEWNGMISRLKKIIHADNKVTKKKIETEVKDQMNLMN